MATTPSKKEEEKIPSEVPLPPEGKPASSPKVEPISKPSAPETPPSRYTKQKEKVNFNPFYKTAGIPHCPVCGEAKRTDMTGKQICTQKNKPDGCWVKD